MQGHGFQPNRPRCSRMISLPVPIGEGTPTLFNRVDSKIEYDAATGCGNWIGAYSEKRRGKRPVIQLGGRGSRVVLVARLQLQRYFGPPPTDTHEAGHTCPNGENSRCVNYEHLQWMTRTENEHHKSKYAD